LDFTDLHGSRLAYLESRLRVCRVTSLALSAF